MTMHSRAGSVVKRSDFESVDALAAHLTSLLRDPAKYARYFAWKVAAARPTGPSWRRRIWPPFVHVAASEGFGLPFALVSRGPAPQMPPRGRGPEAKPRPRSRLRRVV